MIVTAITGARVVTVALAPDTRLHAIPITAAASSRIPGTRTVTDVLMASHTTETRFRRLQHRRRIVRNEATTRAGQAVVAPARSRPRIAVRPAPQVCRRAHQRRARQCASDNEATTPIRAPLHLACNALQATPAGNQLVSLLLRAITHGAAIATRFAFVLGKPAPIDCEQLRIQQCAKVGDPPRQRVQRQQIGPHS